MLTLSQSEYADSKKNTRKTKLNFKHRKFNLSFKILFNFFFIIFQISCRQTTKAVCKKAHGNSKRFLSQFCLARVLQSLC